MKDLKKFSSHNKVIKRENLKCYTCGDPGHLKRECPVNARSKVHRVTKGPDCQEELGPMYHGSVNGTRVSNILRDTGCTCVVVSEAILPDLDLKDAPRCDVSDFLGRTNSFPLSKVFINCSLYQGWVEAVIAPLKYCTVLLGNIEGVKPINVPTNIQPIVTKNPNKIAQPVQTRADKRKTLHPLVVPNIEPLEVSPDQFKELQGSCTTLDEIRSRANNKEMSQDRCGNKFKFIIIEGIMYRECVHHRDIHRIGKRTLIVPLECRKTILELAHDLPVSGHFSHRKTEKKISENFFWPGMGGGILGGIVNLVINVRE